jgi:hypothetical protein
MNAPRHRLDAPLAGLAGLRPEDVGGFRVQLAGVEDASELADLNRSVKLNMAQGKELFSGGEPGFARSGGFFTVMDEAALKNCLTDERSALFVLRAAGEASGPIVASLWISLDDPGFQQASASLSHYLNHHRELRQAAKDGRLCYGRELIVASYAPRPSSPSAALFFAAFTALQKLGFSHALSEVYKVVGYHFGARSQSVNTTNEAALRRVAEAGGQRIAENEPRLLALGEDVSVSIEPQVVLFDFAICLPVLTARLQASANKANKGRERHG